jgi:hypothetical protein
MCHFFPHRFISWSPLQGTPSIKYHSLVLPRSLNVNQSRYRPGQALRIPGVWGSQISRQSAHESGKVVSPTHRPDLPQQIFLVLISVTNWVNPLAIVLPKGLCQWKIPVIPSGIEPATFPWSVDIFINYTFINKTVNLSMLPVSAYILAMYTIYYI